MFTVSSWNSKRKTSAALLLLLLLLLLLAEELQGIKKKVLWALAILEQILFTTVFLGIQRRNLQLLRGSSSSSFSCRRGSEDYQNGFVSSDNSRTDFVYSEFSGNSKKKSSAADSLLLVLLLAEEVQKIIKKVL